LNGEWSLAWILHSCCFLHTSPSTTTWLSSENITFFHCLSTVHHLFWKHVCSIYWLQPKFSFEPKISLLLNISVIVLCNCSYFIFVEILYIDKLHIGKRHWIRTIILFCLILELLSFLIMRWTWNNQETYYI
jgi:hypothetical protein